MTSQNNLKPVIGIVTLLGAITGLITAIAGPEGLPKLIGTFQPKSSEPSVVPAQPSGSPGIGVAGTGNTTFTGSNNTVSNQTGSCNNIQASGQSVTIICSPAASGMPLPSSGAGNFPNISFGNSVSPVKFQASVEGLQRDSDRFTLWLTNATPDQSVSLPTMRLALSDDQGNTYELDPWLARDIGLTKVIPPNGRIKLNYRLRSTIAQDANSVTFTLNDAGAQSTGSPYEQHLPPIQWKTPL